MKKIISDTFTLAILILSFVSLAALFRTNYIWGNVTFTQIIENFKGGLLLVSDELKNSYILCTVIGTVIALITFALFKQNKYPFFISVIIFLFMGVQTSTFSYFLNRHIYSDLYEKEYVNPENIEFTFEKEKRNLIVIYLESMEKNYDSIGKNQQNFIPSISRYISSSTSFNNFYQLSGQTYTLAAMIASMCAVPYNENVFIGGHSGYKNFLNNLVCYPEILRRHGYTTVFLKGADIDFVRTGLFMKKHGFQTVLGKNQLIDLGYTFSENEGTFGGFNDQILYNVAKEKITELSAQNQPFLFSFLTLDTHEPDSFLEPFCAKKTNGFSDIILCADQMLDDFLTWLEAQDFYYNTTIVVLGDHTKPGAQNLDINDKKIQIVNFIINPVDLPQTQHQIWTTLDVAPTILNALGISFKNGKFGLGRSLFSPHPTLMESMKHRLETELQKNSKIYESFDELTVQDFPIYKLWTHQNKKLTDPAEIASYATFSNMVVQTPFLDELSFTLPEMPQNGVKMSIKFQKVFALLTPPTIKVFVNNQLADTWAILPKDPQPLVKTLKISKDLIQSDKRLLIKFQDDKEAPIHDIFGIGLKELQLEMF